MLRVRSSSPFGRVIDIVVIGLAAALIAIFFTDDGTAIRLLRYARSPLPAAVVRRRTGSLLRGAGLAEPIRPASLRIRRRS